MKKTNWFEIVFWVILIVLITMIITRIFGSSATDIQIYIAVTTGMLTIMGYIVKMNREIGELKTQMMNSFKKIRKDINKLGGLLNN